ncbi:hypothetical protein JG068_05 [Burkholderia phage JG068]|uniref:Uncharacterized protein n=1 Tax=Burkholderia phage JG068 TaxID=1401297 RepID=U3PB88_9CAUD|nr:hypothetical protein JG068_05 [Burkholderia phage JG068]AGW43587.1 hypothetical protein JG068_05 [Burkholderia phage JG068]
MSENLRKFLSAWLAWVDGGAGEHEVFSRGKALCSSSEDWYKHAVMLVDHRYHPQCELQYDPKYGHYYPYEELKHELAHQFSLRGLDKVFPFNSWTNPEDEDHFFSESDGQRVHLNAERLRFVREVLNAA